MNGMTNPTGYYFRPNICKCGHDMNVHTVPQPPNPAITANLCSQCLFTGGTQNRHFFAHKMEDYPPNAQSFIQVRDYAYYCVGMRNPGFTVLSTNATTIAGGTTVIPVVSTAGIHVGSSVTVLGTNIGNTAVYQVVAVDPVGLDITINPGLWFAMGATNPLFIGGQSGDTAGPGLTANNQRAG